MTQHDENAKTAAETDELEADQLDSVQGGAQANAVDAAKVRMNAAGASGMNLYNNN